MSTPSNDPAHPAPDPAESPSPRAAPPVAGPDAPQQPPAPAAPDEQATAASPYDGPDDAPAGHHRVARPVPRSGLAEHDSAAYLTGERQAARHDPGDDAAQPPRSEPAQAPRHQPSWPTVTAHDPGPAPRREEEGPDTAVILDGASVESGTHSRTAAHWWGVLVSLVLLPVAWYLLADAGARLTLPAGNPWQGGDPNPAAWLELGGGLLVLAAALLAARWSSVGAILTGALTIILGVPFVAVPQWTQEVLAPALEWLEELGDFGGNLAHHLLATGSTGRFVVYGLALVLLGLVSHGARRQGRREEHARAAASSR